MKNIAVFASGTGSNARRLIDYFQHSDKARVTLVVCNKPGAKVLDVAKELGVESLLITRESFYESDAVISTLREKHIDLVVLAGFLWLIPAALVQAFPKRIINIHPALLPKFGGKGMYGMNVHKAVLAAGEKESGITIHFVNEHYDEGEFIAQHSCPVFPSDSAESLALRVQELEHAYFVRAVESVL